METKELSKPRYCFGYSKAIDKYFIDDIRTKKQMKFTKQEIEELIGCFNDLLKPEGEKEKCQDN